LTGASLTTDARHLKVAFEKFEHDFGKKYVNQAERIRRFAIFAENIKKIERHNAQGHSWTMGVNHFADLTDEEFKANYLNGYTNLLQPGGASAKARTHDIDVKQLPESVDWREQGAVTEVKDQGSCGSCWAFAALHQIESYVKLNGGDLKDLSAQQITSCTPNPLKCGGTGGCFGSIPQLAYSYIQLFGLATEADYSYTSGLYGDTGDCDFDPAVTKPYATLRGFESLPKNDQEAVMEHLATKGPLAVAVAANDWSRYALGVFDGCNYDRNVELNHAVQLVGYGTDPVEGDYWLLRNSWSEYWGEGGYIKLKRETVAQCGTNSSPLSGVACIGDGVSEQYVCGQCGVLFDTNYPIGAEAL